MNYKLNTGKQNTQQSTKDKKSDNSQSILAAIKKLLPLMHGEKKNLIIAFSAILTNST